LTVDAAGPRGRRILALGVLAAAGAVAAAYPSADPDVFFHLAVGREIVTMGGLPATEPFCFPVADRPFVNHEWLFDAVLWATTGGDGAAVVAFKAALAALLLAAAGLVALRLGAGPLATALAGLAFLGLSRPWLEARPHLAAYALAALFILALRGAASGGWRRVAWLPAIAAVWANVHGSFPLALALWALEAVAAWRGPPGARRRLLIAGPLVALAFLANPWGWGILSVVTHHAAPLYRAIVPEWQPAAWGESAARDALFLGLAGLSLASFLPAANRGRLAELGMLLVFLVPAVMSAKFALGLAVSAVPVAAANLSRLALPRRAGAALAGLATCGGIALGAAVPPGPTAGTGFAMEGFPAAAVDAALARGASGRVLASFDVGGYVEFAGHTRLRPFIDGRAYVHGLEGVQSYLAALADYRVFRSLDDRWRFDAVLADLSDPSFPRLLQGIQADPAFELAYLDSRFAWFSRAGTSGDAAFRAVRATTDPRYVWDVPDGALPRLRAEIDRVLAGPGGEVLGLLLRGALSLREAGIRPGVPDPSAVASPARCAAARDDFSRLVALRPEVGMFRFYEGLARLCAGDFRPWSAQ
jgi:hypothetical protein